MTQTSDTFQLKENHLHFQIFFSACTYDLTGDPVAVPCVSDVKQVVSLKPGSKQNCGVKCCPHLWESDIQRVLTSQNKARQQAQIRRKSKKKKRGFPGLLLVFPGKCTFRLLYRQ